MNKSILIINDNDQYWSSILAPADLLRQGHRRVDARLRDVRIQLARRTGVHRVRSCESEHHRPNLPRC